MKIKTVNVIEMADNNLMGITSFLDNEVGNKEAEAHFSTVAKENGAIDADMESFLEEGYFEQGMYQLFLSHSEDGEVNVIKVIS